MLAVEEGAFANLVLDEYLGKHELIAADRALTTELVYGTVKYKLKLDWVIGQLVKKAAKLETKARILLRMGFYQLLFLERVPPSAATNETVKLAKKYSHAGVAALVNGVLRAYLRAPEQVRWPDREDDPAAYLATVYSHPVWLAARWLERYGWDNTIKMCEFNNRPADLWIRANTLRTDAETLAGRLSREGCVVEKSARLPEGMALKAAPAVPRLSSFREGLFTVQDESSMLASHALKPSPGGLVLDLCAGPGGKTTHLAELMKNQGLILACDVHEHRLKLVEENAHRLGIGIIKTLLQDATRLDREHGGKFDLILVDAPCSGLGVLRRRPDARWRKEEKDIKALAALQKEILENALLALKPGGRLVYSTCTTEPEENDGVVRAIKELHPEIESYDLTPNMPYQAQSAAEAQAWREGWRQYLPFSDGMDGFYIAGLKKKA